VNSPEEARLDPAIVTELYLECADDLRAFLIGVLRDHDLAAEAHQAAFAKLLEAGHTARRDKLKNWLFRVAYNEAMALRRQQKTHEKTLKTLAWTPPRGQDEPHDNVSRGEAVNRVRASLKKLPSEQREVVRMRIYDGMTFASIAEEIGVPLGTVLTRMRLALRKLHRDIGNEHDTGTDHAG